jgi:site-specific DNA-methyltransferase (adenine-specific)
MEKESDKILNQEATAKEANEFSTLSTTTIKINSEYSKLVTPLSNAEYESLKNSVKEDELHYPIIINAKGEILDGHHRFRICKELDIPIKYENKYFDNVIEEKRFVIDINLKRRQLNDFQKSELAYKLEDIYKEQARLRQLSSLKNVKDKLSLSSSSSSPSLGSNDHNDNNNEKNLTIKIEEDEKGRVIDIVSKHHGLSPKTYQRAKTIIENGSEDIKEKLRQGKSNISKEFDKIQKDSKRIELLSQIQQSQNTNDQRDNLNDNYKLINADFTKQSQYEIADNSIDLIFTDPPYGRKYLQLYHELAQLASRVLKPGGSLVTFAGHIILNEVFNIFHNYSFNNNNSNILKYWWTLAVKHSGHHQKIYPRHVFAEWKPLIWYVKGERANDLVISNTISDTIQSNSPSKLYHEWEQSTVEAEYIIKNLTIANQTVLDPMMGSGTTGIAALNHRRTFIGIEKDHETFLIANSRIKNIIVTHRN